MWLLKDLIVKLIYGFKDSEKNFDNVLKWVPSHHNKDGVFVQSEILRLKR